MAGPRTHAVLAGIVGYREILAAGGDDHQFRFTGAALGRLVDTIAAAYLRHAALQTDRFASLLTTIPGVA